MKFMMNFAVGASSSNATIDMLGILIDLPSENSWLKSSQAFQTCLFFDFMIKVYWSIEHGIQRSSKINIIRSV